VGPPDEGPAPGTVFEERFRVDGPRHYRLEEVEAPGPRSGAWTYRFSPWPEGHVFRRLVDYARDAEDRRLAHEATLSSRLSRWLNRKPEP
jgi:hypothetical protein